MNALNEKIDQVLASLDEDERQERQRLKENVERQYIDVSSEIAALEKILSQELPKLRKESESTLEKLNQIDFMRLTVYRPDHVARIRNVQAELSRLIGGSYEKSIGQSIDTLKTLRPDRALLLAGEIDFGYQHRVKEALELARSYLGIPDSIHSSLNQIEHLLSSIGVNFQSEKRKVYYPVGAMPTASQSERPKVKAEVKKDYPVLGGKP